MMYYCGILIAAILLSGCKDSAQQSPHVEVIPQARAVARVYQVISPAGSVACYRAADSQSPIVTVLQAGQLVDLVSAEEGTLQQGKNFWLRVYPRLGHRPSCHVNVLNLVPVS